MRKVDIWEEEITDEIYCHHCRGIGDCDCDEDFFKERCLKCGVPIERCICKEWSQVEKEIGTLVFEAQRLMHKAEARVEYLSTIGIQRPELAFRLDASQQHLVDFQFALGKSEEAKDRPFSFSAQHDISECDLCWVPEKRLLTLYLPETWERVSTRPSLYIKDIRRYHNAAEVRLYYTELIRRVILQNKKVLDGWESFESCYVGILLHFEDRYIRDPDNFIVKALVDAAKNARVFKVDNYRKMMYMAGGVHDKNRTGMTLFFSDTVSSFEHLIGYTEVFKEQKTTLRLT